ncbi:(2Fe-2S)-binding protein [Sphingopyxis sp. PAMC25046]|uniref:(2Fe-2S)-binding protein n=1 Tax=Sphingopyxis sp. PAMC25046 TaxID=2565556 RepID=UPI00109DA4F5|nr:(2Fe-2S)-binding protein [Sphingopyxis sp. PAMC25046]QCB56143.1 (2Fe-2S)-binding protein [Sphingopyxis sp. PAMC25046]
MSATRITRGVNRGGPIAITVDGIRIECFAGETVAAAMLAADHAVFRADTRGQRRGMFCNMGVCSECLVTLIAGGPHVRACLVEARDGMEVATRD